VPKGRAARLVLGGVVGLLLGVGIGYAIAAGRGDDDRSAAPTQTAAGILDGTGIPVATDVTGHPLPDVPLETLAGDVLSLRDLAGAPLVLNLWYSTCAPCVREMPAFEAVHRQLGGDVRIVGVNPVDSPAAAERFADDLGVTYELLRDPGGGATVALGVARFPTTVFVDAAGRIVATEPNELDAAELTERIEELFPP
jgi:cytochrome c biogenesis protein CcmG, thiol:disulfide interchange protein DsbE